ncbi:MAG TPA: tetratricopeptide repeat protein [Polyangia bacterium]|nr:tetratricopeptide repeat protein [Polyangia bacterium]
MLIKKDKHLAAAQKFLERGQEERALEEFARVVQEDPNDTRTWLKMAEIHARRGALEQARDIYLRTAEIYVEQGFPRKAMTVYKSVLKLTPGLPHVRERLADTYRQQGMVADALRELEACANELQQAGKIEEALPALRKIVGLHPDNIASRIRLAETASQVGKVDEAVHELSQLAVQVKAQGRADDFVRVAERLLFHRPTDFGVARELAAAYIQRMNPRLALVKLQAPLKAAPRDPKNVTLLAEALAQLDPPKALSVWRELAELHDAAGRLNDRDVAVRAALALDGTDGETRELAGRWGIAVSAVKRPGGGPPPLPGGISGARPLPRSDAPGADRSGPVAGLAGVGISGVSALAGISGISAVTGVPGSSGLAPGLSEVGRVLAQADVFVKYGLVERAVDHLRRVFALDARHRGARERLASVLTQLGRRSEAAAELAVLAGQLAEEDAADAALVAERALTLDPSCAAAAKLLGRAVAAPPAPEAVAAALNAELRGELEQVDFFLQQSLPDEAREVLDELAQRFPGDPLIDEKRAAILRAERAAAQAQTQAAPDQGAIPSDRAAPTIPHGPVAKLSASERADPGTHGDLGIAYKEMGLYDAAIAEFKLLQADKTRAVFALTMIGECVEAKGELGEAVGKYKEALNQSNITLSESLELYYLLGSVFERLGDVREALYFFENLRKRDATFRDVVRRINALKPANARQA